MGLEYGKVVAVEVRCPRRGWNVARDGIDERGLAGPVRTDQADERSGFDDEIHVIVGVEATEGDSQAFGLEKGGHVISLPTMAGWVTCPRRSVVGRCITVTATAAVEDPHGLFKAGHQERLGDPGSPTGALVDYRWLAFTDVDVRLHRPNVVRARP